AMRIAIVAGLVGAVVAVVRRRSAERTTLIGAALLGAVGLAGMSAAGHAASYGGPVAAAVDLLHLLGVTAWLGALPAAVVLAARSGTPRATGGALLRRHGRVALVAAPLVALTGIANSPLVLGAARDVVAS